MLFKSYKKRKGKMKKERVNKYTGEDTSIIVAAYNEERNIGDTVKRIRNTLPDAEIVVVDDGSKDSTAQVVKSLNMKNVRVIRYTPNKGKGNAIRVGINAGKGKIQAQVDADSQFPPEELPGLIRPIINGEADIVFCSRFCKGATVEKGSLTRTRKLANFVVSGFTSILSGMRLTDVNAGFKAWKKKALQDIDIECAHFGYEPEIAVMAGKKHYKIMEVPVNYKGRKEGTTSVKLIRDGIIIPSYLIKIRLFRKA